MDVLRSAASMLAHWDPDVNDNSHEANVRKAERLLAQLPVVMAARHRLKQGKEPVPAESGRSLAANCLYMLFRADPSPGHVKAMDVSLILYAEHEYNASTFTARVIVSTLSDLHSGIAGAIGALKGPLHGGANEKVMDVLKAVGKKENAEKWIRDALARKEKIMGFGHRVYKDGDPRAVYLKELCDELAKETGNEDLEATADVIQRDHLGREEAAAEPRLAVRPAVPLHGPADRAVHAAVRAQPRGRLECPHHRAARQQPADPPAGPVHRPGAAALGAAGGAVDPLSRLSWPVSRPSRIGDRRSPMATFGRQLAGRTFAHFRAIHSPISLAVGPEFFYESRRRRRYRFQPADRPSAPVLP